MNITWCHNPEDHDINFHPYKNLKSYESEWRVIEFNCKPQIVRKFIIHGKEHIKLQTCVKCYKVLYSSKLLISHANYFIHGGVNILAEHANKTTRQMIHQKQAVTLQYIKYYHHIRNMRNKKILHDSHNGISLTLWTSTTVPFSPPHPKKKNSWTGTIPIL